MRRRRASGWFPAPSLLSSGANAYSYLQATETAGWGWAPLTSDSYAGTAPGSGGIADQYEKTKAATRCCASAPKKARLAASKAIWAFVSSRPAITRSAASTSPAFSPLPLACAAAHAADPSACTAIQDLYSFLGADPSLPVGGGRIPGAAFKNSYTNVLPSLNLNFHLTDKLQWRFAVGKSMIRPDFHQTAPFFNLNWNFDNTGAVSAGLPAYAGTVASPLLKPMTSWQGDTSIEYYWGRGNALTLALFYKDIANQITTTTYITEYTNNGVTLPFNVVQNINSNKHAKIKGFEFGYTQFLDFLSGPLAGFGVQANLTYVDATGGLNSAYSALLAMRTAVSTSNLPYEQLSKYSYNVAALYSKDGIDARLAYNWRSHYLLTTISASNFCADLDGGLRTAGRVDLL